MQHDWASPEELLPYLSPARRKYLALDIPQLPTRHLGFVSQGYYRNVGGRHLADEQAATASHDPASLAARWLDPQGLDAAVLTFDSGRLLPSQPNHWLALEFVQAANDWSVERWLSGQDHRLYGSVLVPSHLPDAAVAEIDRIGPHPRVVQVLLGANPLGRPFGHPIFHPIFEAAERHGLAVAIHAGSESVPGGLSSPTAGGPPATYAELHALAAQPLMTHLTSIIAQGVLERHRNLRIVLVGGGVAWIPYHVWRMDVDYRSKRTEIPWVKRLPSEAVREQLLVGTYPLERPPREGALARLLGALRGLESMLCYASGFPAWDSAPVQDVAGALPDGWQPAVLGTNARSVYGWGRVPA